MDGIGIDSYDKFNGWNWNRIDFLERDSKEAVDMANDWRRSFILMFYKKKSWSFIDDLFCNFWKTGRPLTGQVNHWRGRSAIDDLFCNFWKRGRPLTRQVSHWRGRSVIDGAGRLLTGQIVGWPKCPSVIHGDYLSSMFYDPNNLLCCMIKTSPTLNISMIGLYGLYGFCRLDVFYKILLKTKENRSK